MAESLPAIFYGTIWEKNIQFTKPGNVKDKIKLFAAEIYFGFCICPFSCSSSNFFCQEKTGRKQETAEN